MLERPWMNQVMQLARLYRWKVAHFDSSVRIVGKERRFVGDRYSAGFPDLIMVRGERLIFVELKTDKTKTSAKQDEWLAALRGSQSEVYVWRPSDLSQVEAILK